MSSSSLRPALALGKLSTVISRITVRHSSTRRRWKEPRPDLTGFGPDWGEKIWIFHHILTKQIVYSHSPAMDVWCVRFSLQANSFLLTLSRTVEQGLEATSLQWQEDEAGEAPQGLLEED